MQNINSILEKISKDKFTSNSHTSQHRIFGFITTNIRHTNTFIDYIEKLVPEFIKRKDNLTDWKNWTYSTNTSNKYKQAFKRMEIAKILFRNIENSPQLNKIAIDLYRILKSTDYGKEYLNLLLNIYLLNGRYFSIDNQPQVEIEKILNSYKGNILNDSMDCLINNIENKLLFSTIFYNPSDKESYDFAYFLLQNDISQKDIELLIKLKSTNNHFIKQKIVNAGGIGNFKKDIAMIANYYIFKKACFESQNKEDSDIFNIYVNLLFETKLNKHFKLYEKEKLKQFFNTYKDILQDILMFIFGIKKITTVDKKGRKNFNNKIKEKYNHQCFFDYFVSEEKIAHELNYFKTKENINYLEDHHMIQLENAKFFEKDLDIIENIIPVCPNCHRKLHHANNRIILNMIKIFYAHIKKEDLIRKGIFVDINTLIKFYGIEEEIKEK